MAWIQAAEQCQQEELRASCVTELARHLVGGSGGLPGAIANAALLQGLDKDTLLLLLGVTAAAGTAAQVATAGQVVQAVPVAANTGTYSCV